jgi:hypothetical protein
MGESEAHDSSIKQDGNAKGAKGFEINEKGECDGQVEPIIYTDSQDETEELYIQFIDDTKLNKCPHVNIQFGKERVKALIDSGSQISLMSDELYDKLKLSGYSTLEIPVQSTVLITAFQSKSRRVRLQALLEFSITGNEYEQIFLIAPKLITPVILGADFLYNNRTVIDFEEEHIKTEKNGKIWRYRFVNEFERDRDRRSEPR